MHEVAAIRAAIRVAEAVCHNEGPPSEVRLAVGGHMQPGQIGALFQLLAIGTPLQAAAVVVERDGSLGDELRVDSVVVSRRAPA